MEEENLHKSRFELVRKRRSKTHTRTLKGARALAFTSHHDFNQSSHTEPGKNKGLSTAAKLRVGCEANANMMNEENKSP